ncbi:hypothetical protein Pcinc_023472 [Petrolisthes cinctipes]|uniref:Uncharacterized protein n=1 Tax=Petrolisthes cinctipes TaxID=88211 RepID=A0AAE1FEC0_PETCI|nr:hypothetical protein Pcinc_023472 [Petrolisthes cinctipes]
MADFVETDSPLPTPELVRKSSARSNDGKRQSSSPRSPQPFVRTGGVRRKPGGQVDGSASDSSSSTVGRSKGKRQRKGANGNGVVVATSYRRVESSPQTSRRDLTYSPKTKIPAPTSQSPSHHAQKTQNANNAKSKHEGSPSRIPARLGSCKGHQYTKRTGESSEGSEDEDAKPSIVGLSYKKTGDQCWQQSNTAEEATATTNSHNPLLIRDTYKEDICKENVTKVENECKSRYEWSKGTQNKNIETSSDSLQAISKETSMNSLGETNGSNGPQPLYTNILSESNGKSGISDKSNSEMRSIEQNHRKKLPKSPEHNVAILRHGSLPVRYTSRWSAFPDLFSVPVAHTENAEQTLSTEKSATQLKKANSVAGNKKPQEQSTNVAGICTEAQKSTDINSTAKTNIELVKRTVPQNDQSHKTKEMTSTLKHTLNREDWKRKSNRRFSFDNLVTLCSETVASSMKKHIAKSPDQDIVRVKDIGRQEGAAIFGGIVKEVVASLPSDVSSVQEKSEDQSQSSPKFNALSSNVTDIIRAAHQKLCESHASLNSNGFPLEDLPESPMTPSYMCGDEKPCTTTPQNVNNVANLPSFSKMEEPKVLSRRGSVEVQEHSRIRLSKTGRIEVVDSSVQEETDNTGSLESESSNLMDTTSELLTSQQAEELPTNSTPPVKRRTFSERFSLWRRSWNMKYDGQSFSRSESLRLRLHQQRASLYDAPRRYSFSGTVNDLYSLGQRRVSSTAESPQVIRKDLLLPDPTFNPASIRRGSGCNFPQATERPPLTRRHSVDERIKKPGKGEKSSVEKASDAFSYFFDYPALPQGVSKLHL